MGAQTRSLGQSKVFAPKIHAGAADRLAARFLDHFATDEHAAWQLDLHFSSRGALRKAHARGHGQVRLALRTVDAHRVRIAGIKAKLKPPLVIGANL